MKSIIHMAALFLLALTLGACGGAEFSAAEADDGLAGAAGDVDPGTGGTAGSGDGSSGQAGAGNGGTAAGTAGSGSSGSAGAGATGAGGEPSGGSAGEAGSGGAPEPTCTPEEAITTAALSESFTWDGFDGFWEGEDQDYCAYSDGGLCTLRNETFDFFPSNNSVTFRAYLSCSASFAAGPCGAEVACAATVDPNKQASLILSVEPAGNGYRLMHASGPGDLLLNASACNVEMPSGSKAPTSDAAHPDLAGDLIALVARTYPCP